MLTTLLLSFALHASPVEAAPPAPGDFRAGRFAGALVGGLVGLGVGLGALPLADLECAQTQQPQCLNAWHLGVGALTPLLAATGAWVGSLLTGGDGGLLTALAVVVPAVWVAQLLQLVARGVNVTTGPGHLPFVLLAGGVLAGGAALALELRTGQLERANLVREPGAPGRIATAAVLSTAVAIPGLILGALGFALGGPLLGAALVSATLPGVAALAWGLHAYNDGKGSFLAALLGAGVGAVGLFITGALIALNEGTLNSYNPRQWGGRVLGGEAVVILAGLAPVLALELSHTRRVGSAGPAISFGASPIQQGGMVGASLRF